MRDNHTVLTNIFEIATLKNSLSPELKPLNPKTEPSLSGVGI